MSISFENVSVHFGARAALDDVTLRLAPGAVTGIVGPNGAGKTTLLRAALGLQSVSHGLIRIRDKPLGDWSRRTLARAMAYLPQGGEPRWPLPAREVVMLGRLPYLGRFTAPDRADHVAAMEALSRCDAAAFAERRVDELSAGERARVLFARALATGAAILLADEPAAFLDPAHQLRLVDLMREEARRGITVAVTLHDLALASRHCDEVIVLREGCLAAAGPAETALSDPTLAAVFGIAAERVCDPAGRSTLAAFRRI
ncbi:MAG: ABC transporter ATP-binding protein [Alphaproteobacteria bacterium]|nr:ABC transporter ATP-binding protein [Alphaproteobacteria bacterium]